jgi:MinD-like ATPase involved in chromosome partitioning or flagellar assembly
VVVVPVQRGPAGPPTVRPRTVERALSGPADQRSTNWCDRVVLVPGGVGPGRPDHDKRDRARAILPVDGARLVAVLGCTVGAGQTVTTLMVADLLASLRGEAVAAVDLNPAPDSLAELAAPRPVLAISSLLAGSAGPAPARRQTNGHKPRGRGQLDVFAPEVRGDGALDMGDLEYRRVFDAVAGSYGLTLADPGAAAVARVLAVADQLVLVAPASPDAARALAMTQEWLGAHGYGALAANSITVVNGLSKRRQSWWCGAGAGRSCGCPGTTTWPSRRPSGGSGTASSRTRLCPGSGSCARRSCRPTPRWPGCWSPRWPPARSGGG